jgi:hypothetical protein
MVSLALCGLQSCSDDYEDASSIHVYGPNENPPVKSSDQATASGVFEMQGGSSSAATILIDDYADMIQSQLGMSVNELLSALNDGSAVVCPINSGRNVWNKAKANAGDNAWYMNRSGNVCEANDESLYGIVSFDAAGRAFHFQPSENAGGAATIAIGFAIAGPNYNTAVRFIFSMTVYDKSFYFADIVIPAGDYNAYELLLTDLADNLQYSFGITPSDLASGLEDGSYAIYMINRDTNAYVWDGESTANSGGYWVNANNEICSWGADGYSYYIEPWIGDGDDCFGIGRAPGLNSGTTFLIKFGIANADQSKTLSLFLNATLE